MFNDFSLSPFGTCATLPLVTQFGERNIYLPAHMSLGVYISLYTCIMYLG
jgi:hypothetical protein